MIGPPSPEAQPLGDEVSGTGSQTASTQEVVDPAGVNGFVASQIVFPRPTFVIDNLEDFLMSDRHIADRDRWSLQLLGKYLLIEGKFSKILTVKSLDAHVIFQCFSA